MLSFKFHQNRTINEEFDYFDGEREGPPGGKGASIHKFLSQLFLVYIGKCCVSNFIKTAPKMKNLTFKSRGERGGRGDLNFLNFRLNYH